MKKYLKNENNMLCSIAFIRSPNLKCGFAFVSHLNDIAVNTAQLKPDGSKRDFKIRTAQA